ncbi:coenzyme A pyrophosphatase [Tepiditoga spiralis]|uniref:Coenzyme A pyrophosphatase n=1 Tax=Tepiditoga spiralis TaxID=2108365 RepID=A0A7G1GCA1_9BACT|nr:CoA pyrophosphatase [Tepiditoga spiralis]BBE31999.1 coenzyme A pyrophosphatase [Tepiditoga spiralis]
MEIIKKIKNFKNETIGIKNHYSILIPLIKKNNEYFLLYELRSSTLKNQPSEISFPGGKVEENESYKECAIRETYEEIGVKKENINILNKGDDFYSPFGFLIHSYICTINTNDFKINKAEVEKLLFVPINHLKLQKPELYNVNIIAKPNLFPYNRIPNGKKYKWKKGTYNVYFYKYNKYYIWGLTAFFTKKLIEKL